MNLQTIKKALKVIYEKWQSNVGISFFGGELLINLDVIKRVVNFAKFMTNLKSFLNYITFLEHYLHSLRENS
ncbi:hypothetical protein XJ44_08515 [Thermosipho affectus]|uniref:Uncharacterized protein n=1 Tax=Thermosipho affectus TaxID=660294 RepID=A0ABX3IH36_9BACT|nr:hypothetical protein [Thermosipho affectus]ONN26499.1 hypothetical protein XJ44_08515 [Thermosipho affectus]